MADKFQDIRHQQCTYDRPNEGWVCGGDCLGAPCYLGPDQKGKCRAGTTFDGRQSGECLPRLIGGRWLCTRTETHGGESCADGPLPDGSCCRAVPPCQPQPTLRRLRGMIAMVVTIMTAALLVVLLGRQSEAGHRGAAILNPGPLNAAHSTLEQRCDQCHSNMSLGPERLMDMHSSSFDHRAMADSQLCLECHRNIGGVDGRYALKAHGMEPQKLQAKSSHESKPDPLLQLASLLVKKASIGEEELACSTCHVEHHGLKTDMKSLTNRQCQVCHQQQFRSFAHGHPEFEALSYPANRRTRIFFDHLTHYTKHFADRSKDSPESVPAGFNPTSPHEESLSCAACHAPSPTGGTMNVVSYQQSCSGCHENDVRAGKKIPVIGFPALDTLALNASLSAQSNPRSLGAWASFPLDRDQFPFLLLYLLPEEARQAWQRLTDNKIDLADLAEMPPEHVQDVERVAWAVKELFRDLAAASQSETPSGQLGHAELVRRLRDSGFHEQHSVVNGLPPEVFEQMLHSLSLDWPESASAVAPESVEDAREVPPAGKILKLIAEVDGYRNQVFPAAIRPDDPSGPAEGPAPTMRAGEESFGAPNPAGGESFEGASSMPPAAAEKEESFGITPAEESFAVSPVMPSKNLPAESFGGSPPSTNTESFDAPPAGSASGESFGATVPPIGSESFGATASVAPVAAQEEPPAELSPLDRDSWASSGGWQQEFGTIYYRSSGHADPLLKSWLEHVVENVSDPVRLASLRDGLDFRQGTLSKASGSCLRCHSIEERRDSDGRLTGATINWFAYGTSPALSETDRPLTRYNHMSHLLFADCRQCHVTLTQPAEGQEYSASFPKGDSWSEKLQWFDKASPALFHSNFEQIEKATCASCHTETKSGDSCLQCHKYHHPSPDGPSDILNWLRFRAEKSTSSSSE